MNKVTVTITFFKAIYNSTPMFQVLFGKVPEIANMADETIYLTSANTIKMQVNYNEYSKLVDNQSAFNYTVNL